MAKSMRTGWWQVLLERLRLRNLLLGNPLATSVQLEHRLPIYLALAVFASDALSSVAYATEEILIQFEQAGIAALALHYVIPISIAIVILIVIVVTSYRNAIHLYPSGGGSYSVSRENLGMFPALIASSSLIIDYTLTVAVSVSSGVEHLASAVPFLHGVLHIGGASIRLTVLMAVLLILFITIINLRGTRESGWIFAAPAYAFVTTLLIAIGVTIFRYATQTLEPIHTVAVPTAATSGFTAFALGFLVLRAFASGCTALTGVESVSNGVSAFEPPETKNAAKTLLVLMCMLIVLFIGVGFAATQYHVLPSATETVISQVARASFGGKNFLYYLTTFATLTILLVASNTSFAGFPRLLALVARDGYMPKSFSNLGDRLVYTQGILLLALVSSLLVIIFNATATNLIPLYAIGVFVCFTLAQLGMARKVKQLQGPRWRRDMLFNLIGASVTALVALIQAVTKFTQGAFVVVIILPLFILVSSLIRRHYQWFDETMSVQAYDYNPLAEPAEPLTVLVLVSSDIHRGILEGLECGRAIAEGRPNSIFRAVHVEMDPEKSQRLKDKWELLVEPYLGKKVRLDIVPSPYRWLIEPIMEYLDLADIERTGDRVIIVLPEFVTGSWITQFLHNFTGRRLRQALLNRPHVTVVSSRFFMKPMAWHLGRGGLVY